MRAVLVSSIVVLSIVIFPAVSHAQIYAGATVGVGGANVPAGAYAGGYRGTLRLFGGYEFTRQVAVEAMTLDLGTPKNKPETTIGAFGVVAVGTVPVHRWRFSGRVGALSMDGRAENKTTRTAQGMFGLGVGFAIVRGLLVGLETAVSRVEFGTPINDTARVNWTAIAASYRF